MKSPSRKAWIRRIAWVAVPLIILAILWTRLVPIGAKPLPFLLATTDEGHTIPDRPYRIYYNDAGAAHSGYFWTYLVKDYGVCRKVVVQGYSTPGVRNGEEPIPVRGHRGALEIGFARGRRDDTITWSPLP